MNRCCTLILCVATAIALLVPAGAAGHTYGHHSIWQMHSPKNASGSGPKEYWYDALAAPSARQMGYLRKLMEARPFLTQRPDLSLLAFEQTKPWEMCLALRGDGYGTPACPPSGIPDPEYSPYHRQVFEFLKLRERYQPNRTP